MTPPPPTAPALSGGKLLCALVVAAFVYAVLIVLPALVDAEVVVAGWLNKDRLALVVAIVAFIAGASLYASLLTVVVPLTATLPGSDDPPRGLRAAAGQVRARVEQAPFVKVAAAAYTFLVAVGSNFDVTFPEHRPAVVLGIFAGIGASLLWGIVLERRSS